jgi:ribose transport system ATP-binding protein
MGVEDVVEGANRVIVLRNGAVVSELDGDDVDDHRIIELMATSGESS